MYRIVSRHGRAGGLLAACLVALLFGTAGADARGQDRTLKLYFTHTGERGVFTYKRNGKFDPAALKKINHFLRDWRRNEPTKMDPKLLDIIWQVYREVGGKDYIHVVSGYRSMKTNDMLRRRGRGAAKKSLHTRGQAMDFFIPGVPISKLRKAGLQLQRGGVGYYPKSGSPFVHLDTGRVRHWPRMTRKQLVAVFPKGGTLHVPSDGKPLPGYELAKSKYNRASQKTAVAYLDPKTRSIRPNSGSASDPDAKKATVAKWLKRTFAGGADEEEDNNLADSAPAPAPAPATEVAEAVEPAPLPRELSQPARRIALAALEIPETDNTDQGAFTVASGPSVGQSAQSPADSPMTAGTAAQKTTISERLAPKLPNSRTQDQIRLSRLMAQAALRADSGTMIAGTGTRTNNETSKLQVAKAETPVFTVAAPAPKPVVAITKPVVAAKAPVKPRPLVAGPSPQTAGSAIDVAINQGTVGKGNRTITVKTEKTLALAYAGVSSGDDFGPRVRPETTAMVSRPARKAAKKTESFTVPAPSQAPITAQNDDIIDYDLPSRPMPSEVAKGEAAPSEEVVDFARFMGDDTTRTSTFAALEMPRPFAVPGFFTAPASIKAVSQYQSNQPLRFDRFAAAERDRPAVSRLAAVRLDY